MDENVISVSEAVGKGDTEVIITAELSESLKDGRLDALIRKLDELCSFGDLSQQQIE